MGPRDQRRLLAGMWLAWALLCCLLSMQSFDVALSQAMADIPRWLLAFFRTITVAGLGKWYLWPSGLGALGMLAAAGLTADVTRARRYRQLALVLAFVFVAVLLAGLVTDLLKVAVGRTRPKLLVQGALYGFGPGSFEAAWQSFPSGHATTMAALAAALGYLVPRLGWPLVAFAVTISASRVIIGAHYLADVIGGAAVGWFVTWTVRDWFARRGWLFARDSDGIVTRTPPPPAPATPVLEVGWWRAGDGRGR